MEGLEKEFDAYIKKTIKNAVINYAIYETRKKHREVSIELIEDKELKNSLSFLDDMNLGTIENYVTSEKLASILSKLSEKQKEILKLSIVEQFNSNEIAKKMNLSDSRIRHILNDTLKEIKKKMEE